jgi:hypothetical protein
MSNRPRPATESEHGLNYKYPVSMFILVHSSRHYANKPPIRLLPNFNMSLERGQHPAIGSDPRLTFSQGQKVHTGVTSEPAILKVKKC